MGRRQKKVIAVSGYFIILHIGHIELFEQAKKFGELIVIVNNDKQQLLKYGKVIVPLEERLKVIGAIKNIDKVVPSIDKDRTVCNTLRKIKPDMFGNGGDRDYRNIPENEICERLNIELIFGLGLKKQSSAYLIKSISNIVREKKMKWKN